MFFLLLISPLEQPCFSPDYYSMSGSWHSVLRGNTKKHMYTQICLSVAYHICFRYSKCDGWSDHEDWRQLGCSLCHFWISKRSVVIKAQLYKCVCIIVCYVTCKQEKRILLRMAVSCRRLSNIYISQPWSQWELASFTLWRSLLCSQESLSSPSSLVLTHKLVFRCFWVGSFFHLCLPKVWLLLV